MLGTYRLEKKNSKDQRNSRDSSQRKWQASRVLEGEPGVSTGERNSGSVPAVPCGCRPFVQALGEALRPPWQTGQAR